VTLTPDQARNLVASMTIPDGKSCGQCSNYRPFCAQVLRSSKGELDPMTRTCYFTDHKTYFNVDLLDSRREFVDGLHGRKRK